MLLQIRDKAQGWVAWAIVILISIPFALWGIDSYLGGGGDVTVAKVDGLEITEDQLGRNVQRTRIQLRERLGEAYDPELFTPEILRQQVLDEMIADAVLMSASQRMGLAVSDEAVRAAVLAEPAFQRDGGFDKEAYEQMLRIQGLTPGVYEDQLRAGLLLGQLRLAVEATAFATPGAIDQSLRLLTQQRDLSYARFPLSSFLPEQPPTDIEIQAFYEANAARFELPEQIQVSYLLLDAADLALDSSQALTDEALLARYQARIDEFTEPELRRIRHILLTLPANADQAVTQSRREELLAIRDRIQNGEAFGELAERVSEDPGSASTGGDLGLVSAGIMDPAFEQVAFELAPGELSEPVRSRFGYHLIEVTEVQGGEVTPFAEVREQLLRDAASGQAENAFFDVAERLANLTYESPDSLIPAAETLELEIRTSDWFDRSGGEGLFANRDLIKAAFSEAVLVQGNNSDLIEPDPEALQALVLRVTDRRPAQVQPLEEVRERIIELLRREQAAEAALAAAAAAAERVDGGQTLASVVGEGIAVESPGRVGRTDRNVPGRVLQLAFESPRPGAGESLAVSGADAQGDAWVVVLSEVVDGDPAGLASAQVEQEGQLIADVQGRATYQSVLDALIASAKIDRKAAEAATE